MSALMTPPGTPSAHRPAGHTRKSSMMSFGSNKGSDDGGKLQLVESPREKDALRLTSKANPNMAINEMQPGHMAQVESTLQSIRTISHKDAEGNVIVDPDRSNPTRPRLERPLDTIRSFEAAVDGSYNKRMSTFRPGELTPTASWLSDNPTNISLASRKRPSTQSLPKLWWNSRTPYEGASYYGRSRPTSYIGEQNQEPQPPRRYGSRSSSDPMLYNGPNNGNGNGHGNSYSNGYGNGYQGHGRAPQQSSGYESTHPAAQQGSTAMYNQERSHQQQPSYDATTNSTSGSYATEHGTGSTGPSSHNSSVDKIAAASAKSDVGDAYGFTGFGKGGGPILEEHLAGQPAYGQPGYGMKQGYQGNNVPPPPPSHAGTVGSRMVNGSGNPARTNGAAQYQRSAPLSNKSADGQNGHMLSKTRPPPQQSSAKPEKRQSWLKRTFTKNE